MTGAFCCSILSESRRGGGRNSSGGVAQLGEHLPCKQGVAGSNPTISTNAFDTLHVGFEKERCRKAAFKQSGGLFESDVGRIPTISILSGETGS